MAFYGASDLAAMLAEFGVPVTFGTVTVSGIADFTQSEMGGPEFGPPVTERAIEVRIATGSLPGIRSGSTITIPDGPVIVQRALQEGDGAVTVLHCVSKA